MKARIAPSILSANFANLEHDIRVCIEGGADMIHVDVMDGCFVPNLTFGAKVIETVRKLTTLPLDVHLMVVEPQKYFDDFAEAGASIITIHAEASQHVHRHVHAIKERGLLAGLALNPATSLDLARDIAPDLDLLLVMTVNPGFAAQKFIARSPGKLARARALLRDSGSSALLEVDGGVSRATISSLWQSGADTFVAGNSIFTAADPRGEIGALRGLCGSFA